MDTVESVQFLPGVVADLFPNLRPEGRLADVFKPVPRSRRRFRRGRGRYVPFLQFDLSGWRVKQNISIFSKLLTVFALVAALAACGTRPAPDFGGRWKSANRFSETAEAIPLQDAYLYYASPMDGTLKKMLERWAKDSNMQVDYRHPMDYTLYTAVASIRTPSLQEAVSQLNAAYGEQQVSIGVSGDQIVVRVSSGADSSAP